MADLTADSTTLRLALREAGLVGTDALSRQQINDLLVALRRAGASFGQASTHQSPGSTSAGDGPALSSTPALDYLHTGDLLALARNTPEVLDALDRDRPVIAIRALSRITGRALFESKAAVMSLIQEQTGAQQGPRGSETDDQV